MADIRRFTPSVPDASPTPDASRPYLKRVATRSPVIPRVFVGVALGTGRPSRLAQKVTSTEKIERRSIKGPPRPVVVRPAIPTDGPVRSQTPTGAFPPVFAATGTGTVGGTPRRVTVPDTTTVAEVPDA